MEAKKADLEIPLAKEKIEKTPLSKEQIVFFISWFNDGDIDNPKCRKDLVDIFVNSIFLYDDKIIIAFNWKGGLKTVSLAGLEPADENAANEGMSDLRGISGSHFDDNPPPNNFSK